MKILNMKQIPKEPYFTPLFTGGTITRQVILGPEMDKFMNMAIINFSKGARNKLHTHSSDQVLIVTGGKGIVATENERKTVTQGDVIFIPAGEKHWHGATKDSDFSHLYVLAAGSKTGQFED
jgi:quercetin dioxygenase-like cupin family protein